MAVSYLVWALLQYKVINLNELYSIINKMSICLKKKDISTKKLLLS